MATDGLLQIPASSCGIDEEFNVNSLLMSAAEDGWACGNPDGDFLSELLDATNSAFLSDLLDDHVGRSGLNENQSYSDNQTSPSSATSDDGCSVLNSFSPDHSVVHSNSYSPPFSSVSTDCLLPADASVTHDVHIDVDMPAEVTDQYLLGSSSTTPPILSPSTQQRRSGGAAMFVSEEERELLSKEGIIIPIDLPLTKSEEKHVKRIRRKIKNKQSAADSRRKKKDYVDGLERRVEKCTEMNNSLVKKVKLLETENKSLIEQLKRLQAYVSQYNPSKLQTGSFMMIVILSFSLLIVPQVYKPRNIHSSLGHSRSLLDIASDEFGNILQQSENGFVGLTKDRTPVLPLPWEYQTPALKPWNVSEPLKNG